MNYRASSGRIPLPTANKPRKRPRYKGVIIPSDGYSRSCGASGLFFGDESCHSNLDQGIEDLWLCKRNIACTVITGSIYLLVTVRKKISVQLPHHPPRHHWNLPR